MVRWLRKLFGQNRETRIETKVRIYPNPLVGLLDDREAAKGAHLTRDEVLEVRDRAVWMEVTQEQANKFHEAFDAQIRLPRLNPDRIWEEWQELNGREV